MWGKNRYENEAGEIMKSHMKINKSCLKMVHENDLIMNLAIACEND